jgi:hypothetical protein
MAELVDLRWAIARPVLQTGCLPTFTLTLTLLDGRT